MLGVWTWTFQKGSRGRSWGGVYVIVLCRVAQLRIVGGRMLLSGTLNVEGVTCHEEWRPLAPWRPAHELKEPKRFGE